MTAKYRRMWLCSHFLAAWEIWGTLAWPVQRDSSPPHALALVWAAGSGSFLKKTIQLRVLTALCCPPHEVIGWSLWWQNQFVTGLSFTVLSQACWQACRKLWQEWQQRRLSERRKGKKQEAETGGSHLLLSCAMGWLEELNWQLHISLLILLSMHTRGKKMSAPGTVLTRGCVNVRLCGFYHRREGSGQKYSG